MKLLNILTEEFDLEDFRAFRDAHPEYNYTEINDKYDEYKSDLRIGVVVDAVLKKATKLNFTSFINSFNREIKSNGVLKDLVEDYNGDLMLINTSIAKRFLTSLAVKLGISPDDVDHKNESKNSANHFQLTLYAELILWATFVYVDDNHRVVADRTNVEIADSRSGDKYLETLFKFGK